MISKFYLVEGKPLDINDSNGVWLDKSFADVKGLKVGDNVSFTFGDYEIRKEENDAYDQKGMDFAARGALPPDCLPRGIPGQAVPGSGCGFLPVGGRLLRPEHRRAVCPDAGADRDPAGTAGRGNAPLRPAADPGGGSRRRPAAGEDAPGPSVSLPGGEILSADREPAVHGQGNCLPLGGPGAGGAGPPGEPGLVLFRKMQRVSSGVSRRNARSCATVGSSKKRKEVPDERTSCSPRIPPRTDPGTL